MTPAMVLDACVLYPPLVRRLLLDAARVGLFRPVVSPRILAEWSLAAARKGGPGAEREAIDEAARLRRDWPGAEVTDEVPLPAVLDLPDAADRHVVGTALAADARTIATFNLRDFPARRLGPVGVEARHPDGLLWQWFSEAPAIMGPVIDAALQGAPNAPDAGRSRLKRAGLPRLGKAWQARA